MAYIDRDKTTLTVDAAGAGTFYTKNVNGLLHSLYLVIGTLANTVDLTITEEDTGKPIVTLTDVAASTHYLPRAATVGTTNAALLYSAGNPVAEPISVNGRIKIVVVGGGVSTTGTLYTDIA